MQKFVLLLGLTALLFVSCQAAGTKPAANDDNAKTGYAFGVLIGSNLKHSGISLDYDAFVRGMKDVLEKNAPSVDAQTANATVQAALAAGVEKVSKAAEEAETKFLAENGKKSGVTTTASGLQYEVLAQGTGPRPKDSDTVKVDYVGTLLDGTKFDSSIDRGQPAVFPLNGVIPGWTEGLQLMPVGSKFKFYIPSKLAYGPNGAGDKIGPNATLIFEVTLHSIEAPAKK